MRRRVLALLAVETIAAGVAVHVLGPESFLGDAAGDVLCATIIVLLVAFAVPRVRWWAVGAVALAWCVGVELSQLTSLHAAIERQRTAAVQVLLEHGASAVALDGRGRPPLLCGPIGTRNTDIADMGEVAKLLLGRGADVTPAMRENVERIGRASSSAGRTPPPTPSRRPTPRSASCTSSSASLP